jgi:hypothetical protein
MDRLDLIFNILELKMTRGIIRYILFLLAYIPIYIIAALKLIDNRSKRDCGCPLSYYEIISNNIIPLFLICLTLILIIYFKIYSYLSLKPKGNPIFTIKRIRPQHKEYVTYLGTYILPFVGLEAKNVFDMISVTFMFLTIGFIFSKTNLIYTNPTLVLFGYDIYEVEDEYGNLYDCITKDLFIEGERPRGIRLGDKTFIISKWKNSN